MYLPAAKSLQHTSAKNQLTNDEVMGLMWDFFSDTV